MLSNTNVMQLEPKEEDLLNLQHRQQTPKLIGSYLVNLIEYFRVCSYELTAYFIEK